MKTREELIAEVLRLNTKRTQGEWCFAYGSKSIPNSLVAAKNSPYWVAECSPSGVKDAQFISRAPDMARIIRDQQKQIEMLVEALDDLECEASAEIDPNTSLNIAINNARKTLTRIKSGEWMEDL
jgi:hypothetical protein